MQSMQSATTCSNEFKSICVNKGFMILEEKMLGFGYHYVVNSMDHILFQKKNNDYDFFEIRISNDKIFVSVPIKKSRFQYKTHFLSYFEASEYVEMQLINFESKDEEDEEVSEEIQTGQANKKDVQASEDAQANEDNE
jgi:hypothetical protein